MHKTSFGNLHGGGIFDFLNPKQSKPACEANNDSTFVKYLESIDFSGALKLLQEKQVYDITITDKNKNNALHLLALHASQPLSQVQKYFLKFIRKRDKDNKLINMKNVDGNTPLHLAVQNKKGDLAKYYLTELKADTSIKNGSGEKVKYSVNEKADTDLESDNSDSKTDKTNSEKSVNISKNTSAKDMLDEMKDMIKKTSESLIEKVNEKTMSEESDKETEKVIKSVRDIFKKNDQTGGDFLRKLYGGKSIKGTRVVELARQYDPEASKVRNQVLDKIKEITGLSEEEARGYRAHFWKQYKKTVQGNNVEKWSHILKEISGKSKSYFDSIKEDVDQTEKEIKKHIKEKEERRANQGDKKEKPLRKNKTPKTPKSDSESEKSAPSTDKKKGKKKDIAEKPAKKEKKSKKVKTDTETDSDKISISSDS